MLNLTKHVATGLRMYHYSQNGSYGSFYMKSMSARDAKNRFGYLLDTARHEPVSIEKHGRPVVIVISVEDFERLSTNMKQKPLGGDHA